MNPMYHVSTQSCAGHAVLQPVGMAVRQGKSYIQNLQLQTPRLDRPHYCKAVVSKIVRQFSLRAAAMHLDKDTSSLAGKALSSMC